VLTLEAAEYKYNHVNTLVIVYSYCLTPRKANREMRICLDASELVPNHNFEESTIQR
jgi:hypothetical protein